jgi:hypothetical protein
MVEKAKEIKVRIKYRHVYICIAVQDACIKKEGLRFH